MELLALFFLVTEEKVGSFYQPPVHVILFAIRSDVEGNLLDLQHKQERGHCSSRPAKAFTVSADILH